MSFELVCWYPSLDHILLHSHRAVTRLVPTTTVLGRTQAAVRKNQGWDPHDLQDLSPQMLDSPDWWHRGCAILDAHPTAVHMFNTLWTDPRFFPLIVRAQVRGMTVGLLTEPYSDTLEAYFGEQSTLVGHALRWARPVAYRAAGALLRRRMGPIFAISPKAVTQFRAAGFEPSRVYPYGYFVATSACTTERVEGVGGAGHATALRAIYVGAMISRKGLDTAAQAIRQCRASGVAVELDLYGSGDPSAYVGDGVTHRGTIPAGQAQRVMAGYDVLLLPSRYDGWGVVVNEALQQGTPVLASRNAGASALVETSGSGGVFEPRNSEALAALLTSAARDPHVLAAWRERAIAYRSRLDPDVAARYLVDCVESHVDGLPRPTCPWY